jgi:endonuclease YncB( thermonuclease family)
VPDSGTLEAGDVVIKLSGIVAHKADAQCQDKNGKNWPCGTAAKAALRRLIRARAVVRPAWAKRAEVVYGALCRLRHRPLHLDGAARLGEAKRPTGAYAC